MKAILELDMPESCYECPLEYVSSEYNGQPSHCIIRGIGCPSDFTENYTKERAPFCPLKERQENA